MNSIDEGLLHILLLLSVLNVASFYPGHLRSTCKEWKTNSHSFWRLTTSPQEVFDSNGDLQQILACTNLTTWFRSIGAKPPHNLREMIDRHPYLMAQALRSDRIHSPRTLMKERAAVTDEQWKKKLAHEASLSRNRARSFLLLFETKLQMTSGDMNKILWNQPKLVQYRPDRLQQITDYLIPLVGLAGVQAMVKRWPILLTYSLEHRIEPGVKFVQSLGDTRWERVLVKYPQILTHSVEDFLEPRLEYLSELLHIASVRQLVTHFAPLLWLSPELLESKVSFLREALELTQDETEILIETYPQVLGLSVDRNLKPTIDYLLGYFRADELREFCLYQPALLAYSLERRLKPRIEQMEAVNINVTYAPAYLMSLTDAKFEQW